MSGMACPSCRAVATTVRDSRATLVYVRRRRACVRCGERFTTYEISSPAFAALTDTALVLGQARKALDGAAAAIEALQDESVLVREDFEVPTRGDPKRRETAHA